MPAILLVVGALAIVAINHEYQQIKARLAITQNKVDALADETDATVEILGAAIQDLRELFAKLSSDAKPSLDQYESTPEATPEVAPEVKPRIVMHSGKGCAPCEKWKRESMQVWKNVGWDVEVIDEKPEQATKQWPWFEVYDSDGSRFEVYGPLTKDTFEKAKRAK